MLTPAISLTLARNNYILTVSFKLEFLLNGGFNEMKEASRAVVGVPFKIKRSAFN